MKPKYLKNPEGKDYFEELLKEIREIRASEKRFYAKIKDISRETSRPPSF